MRWWRVGLDKGEMVAVIVPLAVVGLGVGRGVVGDFAVEAPQMSGL